MMFRNFIFFVLIAVLSNSVYAVTAEDCVEAAYQTLDAYYVQPGLADERREPVCENTPERTNLYLTHYCEGTLRPSTRMQVALWNKDEYDPLLCEVFIQSCDGVDFSFSGYLDNKGELGKAKGQILSVCHEVLK